MEYQEDSSNKSFVIASVALGGLFVAGLISLGLYAFKIKPAQASANATQIAEINVSNTQVAVFAEATSVAQVAAVVSSDVEQQARVASNIESSSVEAKTDNVAIVPAEPVTNVQEFVSEGASSSIANQTDNKTVSVLNNESETSSVVESSVPAAAEVLPETGFADEVALPVLVVVMLILVSIIVVTRSVRSFAS